MTELEKFETNYTALVRRNNVYSVRHDSYCHSMKEYANELRGNGFKVAKKSL